MNPESKQALIDYLITMADDELILGHRNSEWCGHAPILEEDIAFANIALDEIGHAIVWYELAADLQGEEREAYANHMVYFRDVRDYRNTQLVELPKGDWAFTMLRQYLFDQFEMMRLEKLAQSSYAPFAEAATKIRTEEIYHLRHTQAWARRLGLGTEESHRRMQAALNDLWPYALALCEPSNRAELLTQGGYIPDSRALKTAWLEQVTAYLGEVGLAIPTDSSNLPLSRTHHTEHLGQLLSDLQQVARLDPMAKW
ncbi:MAG: phenylacetate-CoA oxygenase subunit PaaC [Chloroflexi bacterium]|nr:phenylacetate-CoA oxygenase subunit PaaC [Chloroflexota bacterium]